MSNKFLSSGNILFAWFRTVADNLFSKKSSKHTNLSIEHYSNRSQSGSLFLFYGSNSIQDNTEDSEWSELYSNLLSSILSVS